MASSYDDEEDYICADCGLWYEDKKTLQKHLNVVHGVRQRPHTRGLTEEEKREKRRADARARRAKKKNEDRPSGDGGHPCPHCKKRYKTKGSFHNHVSSAHPEHTRGYNKGRSEEEKLQVKRERDRLDARARRAKEKGNRPLSVQDRAPKPARGEPRAAPAQAASNPVLPPPTASLHEAVPWKGLLAGWPQPPPTATTPTLASGGSGPPRSSPSSERRRLEAGPLGGATTHVTSEELGAKDGGTAADTTAGSSTKQVAHGAPRPPVFDMTSGAGIGEREPADVVSPLVRGPARSPEPWAFTTAGAAHAQVQQPHPSDAAAIPTAPSEMYEPMPFSAAKAGPEPPSMIQIYMSPVGDASRPVPKETAMPTDQERVAESLTLLATIADSASQSRTIRWR